MAEHDDEKPTHPPKFRRSVALRFRDRYACPGCGGALDTGMDDHWTCTRCGDEWPIEQFDPPAAWRDGNTIRVGRGDTIAFTHSGHRFTGEVLKVNRRSVKIVHPLMPDLLRGVAPERVLAVTYPEE